ncbi:MAG: GNAT family N-acetyltransferase [Anaerolineae bacterium]|nr:GNAT family N-acetyltransferase [Anaerolineae bacterium]
MTRSIEVMEVDPNVPEAKTLIAALDDYQSRLYPAESNHLDSLEELAAPNVTFVVARLNGQVVGCGAVKAMRDAPGAPGAYGEIKRMYVAPAGRGHGLAKMMLAYLEQKLLAKDIPLARLETGIHQAEAIGLYERLGYRRIGPFGDYREDPPSVFMEKRLDPVNGA